MGVNLAEELLLLAYDDAGDANAGTPALDYGLAGALMLDLTLRGRLDVVDRRVVVLDHAPTGDPVLDQALDEIANEPGGCSPQEWIGRLNLGLRDQILDHLVAGGVLRRERDKVLWIFPRTRYPASTPGMPTAEAKARQRLADAVGGTGPVSARTAALASLVRALHLERTAVPARPRKEVRDRFKAIADEGGSIAGEAGTGDAITTMETAVHAAIAEVMVITTTAAAT
ncbi:MAG TPA: GPP34 family phosphoprotein [Micromonosporaceae bacterium]